MGELDKKQKQYFEDPRRFADIWNALMFQGLEVVSSEELSEGSPVQSYADPDQTLERIADMIMKRVSDGNLLALLVLENAGNVDYAITPKIFLEEALAYNKQVKQIRRRNKKLREAMKAFGPVGELLYQFKKTDRLRPVATLVLYWSEEPWDGANTMEEIIDFRGVEELREFVPKFKIHFVDMSKVEDTSLFKTDVRSMVEYFQRRNDKEKFREYLENCEEEYDLDEDGMLVLGELVKSKELKMLQEEKARKKTKENDGEGSGDKMCKAITELIEEGVEKGRQEERENTYREAARADAEKDRADAEKDRADAEKKRADANEMEISKMRELLKNAGIVY